MSGSAVPDGPSEGKAQEADTQSGDYERAMERLREDHPPAPSELVDDILAYVFSVSEEDLPEQKERIRWFLIGGVVAATFVLAVVGIVLLRRGWIPDSLWPERAEPPASWRLPHRSSRGGATRSRRRAGRGR